MVAVLSGSALEPKMRKRTKTYIIGIAILICSGAALTVWHWWPTAPVQLSHVSADQWRADLRYLAQQLEQRHANAFHHISRDNFHQLVATVDNLIQSSDASDVPFHFLRLTAAIGDGHTYIQTPMPTRRYPLRLYWFGDELRVIRTTSAAQQALGLRLTKINETPIEEIVVRLRQIISQDENQWFFMHISPFFIIKPEALHALGIIKDTRQARFTFAKDDGQTLDLTLTPASDQQNEWHEAYSSPPLYLQHGDDSFWFTSFPETKTVYVIFNSYDGLFMNTWKLFRYLDSHPMERLIIDMRGNGGGDYRMGHWLLIDRILRQPYLNRRGHLFVITGRETFSAAMSNAAQFRVETNATLVGEPPGEVPNSYQEHRSFVLPNSHLEVNYSVRYYKFLQTDERALVPDQQIAPDWISYRKGVDPVLASLGISSAKVVRALLSTRGAIGSEAR